MNCTTGCMFGSNLRSLAVSALLVPFALPVAIGCMSELEPPIEPPLAGDVALTIEVVDPIDGSKTLAVDPMFDDQLEITITGLSPQTAVDLHATRGSFSTSLTLESDGDGELQVNGDRLAWSMTSPDSNANPFEDLPTRYEVMVDGEQVASQTLSRRIFAADLVVRAVRVDGLVATLMLPATQGPHPVVVVVGGSEGGASYGDYMGGVLASHGYASLSLAYFGVPTLPGSLSEIPLGYFEKALDFLDAESTTDGTRIAVMGASRGGELALLLGARFPQISAVIAEVPSGLRWGGSGTVETSSWADESGPLAFVPSHSIAPTVETIDGQQVLVYTPTFIGAIEMTDASAIDAATTRVENIAGPVLMVAGADDKIWPSCQLGAIAFDRLEASGHSAANDNRSHCFDAVGHEIGLPGWPTTNVGVIHHPVIGATLATGGEPEATGHAQRVYQTELHQFLGANL